jgi:hypothetical protein
MRIGEGREWRTVALMLPVAVLILLGVVLPGPVSVLIDQCVSNLMPR